MKITGAKVQSLSSSSSSLSRDVLGVSCGESFLLLKAGNKFQVEELMMFSCLAERSGP